ncbi:hypothetical protein BGZ61DRAFT_50339 [Ilyonectria robusta]|uniref:uncharacterized protein n=1 Tax=Ilyonectria robusta TaxID=1079257 RepID=UPI001E8E96DB|nr:uncharacterized protein BGZ61DRAFT_50339 [Ilyonectria robusta]KAH8687077.1 hypothetical protein BGZ61DRAFT_50339 [Ilyonectria robusta]
MLPARDQANWLCRALFTLEGVLHSALLEIPVRSSKVMSVSGSVFGYYLQTAMHIVDRVVLVDVDGRQIDDPGGADCQRQHLPPDLVYYSLPPSRLRLIQQTRTTHTGPVPPCDKWSGLGPAAHGSAAGVVKTEAATNDKPDAVLPWHTSHWVRLWRSNGFVPLTVLVWPPTFWEIRYVHVPRARVLADGGDL